jgi:hypothetical protein
MAAAKKTAPAKAKPADTGERWCYMMHNSDEAYAVFKTYDAMMKDIRESLSDHYYNDYNYNKTKNPKVRVFKLDREIELEVTVTEVPVTKKTVTAKVKE